MQVVSSSKSNAEVGPAMESAIDEVNQALGRVNGEISKLLCEIATGPIEATATITVFVNGDRPVKKEVVGVNEKSYTKEKSIKKADQKINEFLRNKKGIIADSFVKTITTLPTRVYTTIIVGINSEDVVEEMGDVKLRRERLKRAIELLGNDPNTINIAEVAKLFGVSRPMVYKDIEAIGYTRYNAEKEEEQKGEKKEE